MEKTKKIVLPGTVYRPNKRSKTKNLLTKEQIIMLKTEYKITMTAKNTEAEALKLLKGGTFTPVHTLPLKPSIDGRLLLKITKRGKKIYQWN